MTDIAIRVEGLSKQYCIGRSEQHETLRDRIQHGIKAPFRKMASLFDGSPANGDSQSETFWALKDVSFEVPRGSVLGVIGRNGAGKSTLLKILSRVTEPTEGRAEIHGRVGSLLEVGTGFHAELSGRDNIFLNGAILGMKKAEIARKFDEIVAFAEVEKFIDTAVKFYSSGMYVRLAFAVAAHLEPEILILDEVLAVGDTQFQKKCIGKMKDVSAKDGRTVLFVSHNLAVFRRLCTDGLLLEAGEVAAVGRSDSVADDYAQKMLIAERSQLRLKDTGYTEMRLVDADGIPVTSVRPDQRAFVELSLRITDGSSVQAGFTIYNQFDVPLVLCASEHGGVDLQRGEQKFRVRLPSELLQPGIHRIEGAVWEPGRVFHQSDYLCHFQLLPTRLNELHGRSSAAQFVLREPWISVSGMPAQSEPMLKT